jgi:hypothetical protein
MANIELDGPNKKIKVDSGDLTLDVPGDIVLDADGGDVVFADGGTNLLKVTNSSSDVVLQPQVDTKDIVFKQYDGTVVATVEDNATFNIPASKLAIGGTAVTSTAAELNILDGVTATATELNLIDGVTATTAELNILDGVTATAAEINLIDGGTARGTTAIADGDGVLINDAGTMRMTSVETLATYIGGGITMADQWRITSDFAGDANPIASNWERNDTDFAQIGTGLTESSGIFTFPSTGIYRVDFQHLCKTASSADSQYNEAHIRVTANNSTYNSRATASSFLQITGGTDAQATNYCTAIVDVTNTSNVKIATYVEVANNNTVTLGGSDRQFTGITVVRLGDT